MRLGCLCDRGLDRESLRGVAFNRKMHCPACWAFWHDEKVNKHQGGAGSVPIRKAPTITQMYEACAFRGKLTGAVEECKTCSGKVPVPLYECNKLGGTCFAGNYTVPGSRRCNACSEKSTADPSAPKVGVVIGSYLWPSLTEMQIKLIRRTCGAHVPILVVDDKSEDSLKRERICMKYGVDFLTTGPERVGHVGGDLAALHHGLRWAKEKNVEVLAKLSQRIFFTRPWWLQEGAKELIASTLPLASRESTGKGKFPLRSEAYLVDVSQWEGVNVEVKKYNPEGPLWVNGEQVVASLIPGGLFWPWSELDERRETPRPHEINHWANKRSDYEALAKELGVKLDAAFHSNGWEQENARGEYLPG